MRGNIKARERMVIQYSIAGQLGYLVVGTDHAAEAITGFFTKFGDGGVDVTPLTGSDQAAGRCTATANSAHPRAPGTRSPPPTSRTTGPPFPTRRRWECVREIDDYLEGKDVPEAAAKLERCTWTPGTSGRSR